MCLTDFQYVRWQQQCHIQYLTLTSLRDFQYFIVFLCIAIKISQTTLLMQLFKHGSHRRRCRRCGSIIVVLNLC